MASKDDEAGFGPEAIGFLLLLGLGGYFVYSMLTNPSTAPSVDNQGNPINYTDAPLQGY